MFKSPVSFPKQYHERRVQLSEIIPVLAKKLETSIEILMEKSEKPNLKAQKSNFEALTIPFFGQKRLFFCLVEIHLTPKLTKNLEIPKFI